MQGSIPRKIGRLTADLLRHPGYISRCISHHPLKGRSPLEFEIPWFSYAAIDFLKEYLHPQMIGFEYGSGGSTLFFSRRTKSVLSIEDNVKWHDLVSQRLREKGVTNVKLKLHPFDFKNPLGFEKCDYLNAMPKEKFDVIVVDGSEEWTQVRPICFNKAEQHVKEGGIIVVYDSWRYPVLRKNHRAKELKIFQSVGPCRPGVTSTDIFFY